MSIKEKVKKFLSSAENYKNKYNEKGEEIMDPRPLSSRVGLKQPETLAQQIARILHSERAKEYAKSQGRETFEEADDFDVEDDIEMNSPYEQHFDHAVNLHNDKKAYKDSQKKKKFKEEEPVDQKTQPKKDPKPDPEK